MATASPYLSEDTDRLTALVVVEICSWLGRRRMSQAALARTIDKAPTWVSERLTGKSRITLDDLELFARGLKVHAVDLLPRAERNVTAQYDRGGSGDVTPRYVDFVIPTELTPPVDRVASTPVPSLVGAALARPLPNGPISPDRRWSSDRPALAGPPPGPRRTSPVPPAFGR